MASSNYKNNIIHELLLMIEYWEDATERWQDIQSCDHSEEMINLSSHIDNALIEDYQLTASFDDYPYAIHNFIYNLIEKWNIDTDIDFKDVKELKKREIPVVWSVQDLIQAGKNLLDDLSNIEDCLIAIDTYIKEYEYIDNNGISDVYFDEDIYPFVNDKKPLLSVSRKYQTRRILEQIECEINAKSHNTDSIDAKTDTTTDTTTDTINATDISSKPKTRKFRVKATVCRNYYIDIEATDEDNAIEVSKNINSAFYHDDCDSDAESGEWSDMFAVELEPDAKVDFTTKQIERGDAE